MEFKLSKTPEITWREEYKRVEHEPLIAEITLNKTKDRIDTIESDVWKKIRWYINHYDFIVKDPIINRAFFKYWEMIITFDLLKDIKTALHLAEAPGGFIQGTNLFSRKRPKRKNVVVDGFTTSVFEPGKEIEIFTMSLDRYHPKYFNYNLPSYNDHVLKSNVHVIYGKDGTGDLCNMENYLFLKSYINKKLDFITADGGFDEGDDFNNKEALHYKLIFYSVYYALSLQNKSGSFVLKVFDMFSNVTREILLLLEQNYTDVYIYKPLTSRPTNSEKYIICKGFKDTATETLRKMEGLMETWDFNECISFLDVPSKVKSQLHEFSDIIVRRQVDYLTSALSITNDQYSSTLVDIKRTKFTKYIEWCKKYNFKLICK
jgi:23S rRNA U2552 (ribose-2'-O)-methylase RlmE/FtsJ